MKKYSGDSPFMTAQLLCPICAAGPFSISSSLPSVSRRLHGNTRFLPRLRTAASQRSQMFIAARVRSAHTWPLLITKYFITSSRVEAHCALPKSRSVLSRCSSSMLTMGLHSARLASACNPFFSRKAKYVECRKSQNHFSGRASAYSRD